MTANEPPAPVLCVVCGDPRDDHARIHPFTSPGVVPDGSFLRPQNAANNQQGLSVDLVLRHALLSAGVIMPEQLRKAYDEVRAMTGGVGDDDSGPTQG